MNIHGRYFVVGSARSGTTLLQAMLAAHPRVFSLPETHFFCEALSVGRRQKIGLARRKSARIALERIASRIQRDDLRRHIPSFSPFIRSYTKAFERVLDQAAIDAGADVWVEKTPHHIDFSAQISRSITDARFIHIVRDGRDVLASQRKAMQQDPEYWDVDRWPLSKMVDLWNRHVKQSLALAQDPSHCIVSYEELILDSERALRVLCGFMDIEFDAAMLRHWDAAHTVAGPMKGDPWMANVFRPVTDTRLRNFGTVFSEREREYVEANLLFGGDVRNQFQALSLTTV